MQFRNLDSATLETNLRGGAKIANDHLKRYKETGDNRALGDFETTRRQVYEMAGELERRGNTVEIRGLVDNRGSGAGREDTRGHQEGNHMNRSVNDHEVRALAEYLRTGEAGGLQQRALGTTSGSIGGHLVPIGISGLVLQDVAALESLRRGALGAPGATVLPIDGNANLPLMNDAQGVYYSEAATDSGIADTAPSVSAVELRPQLLICRVPIKWHLLNRSAADIQAEIVRSFTRGIAKTENQKFFQGTGTNEPEGITTVSPAVVAASPTLFTEAEIDEVFYSMATEYVNQSAWIVSPMAATRLRALETSAGVPLINQDRADGLTRLHGRPVIIDSYMPTVEADAVPVILADMAEGYVIGEEESLTVLADPYSRSQYAETVVSVFKFNDGRIRRSTAVKALKMAAGL